MVGFKSIKTSDLVNLPKMTLTHLRYGARTSLESTINPPKIRYKSLALGSLFPPTLSPAILLA